MSGLKNFTLSAPRPLPVIILADISGSMTENGKISILNKSIQEMIASFGAASTSRVEIQVAIITFGGDQAVLHLDLTPAAQAHCDEMVAAGRTPMGLAFLLAHDLIEDRTKIPSRAYAPALILATDAKPTDTRTTDGTSWMDALQKLLTSNRASKAARYALAIGEDANKDMLLAFLNDPDGHVFEATESDAIHRFFGYVTMSVTARSQSSNPNQIQPTDPGDFEY